MIEHIVQYINNSIDEDFFKKARVYSKAEKS
jgi:hypothetical protein